MPGPVPVHSAVPALATPFLVAPERPTRRNIVIYNGAATDLYVSFFAGITLTNFTIKIPPAYWGTFARQSVYTGPIYGILYAADPGKFVQVTELVN